MGEKVRVTKCLFVGTASGHMRTAPEYVVLKKGFFRYFDVQGWIRVRMEDLKIEFLKHSLAETFSNFKFGLWIPPSVCLNLLSMVRAHVDLFSCSGEM